MKKFLTESTFKITWVSSGITPTDIHAAVYNGDETLVHSSTMVSSGAGSGHYYLNYTTPTSIGYFVAETNATVNGNPYRRRNKFETTNDEVD